MGDPRRLRKAYKRPYRPFEKSRIDEELVLLGEYGLRNKKELWRHAAQLRNYRNQAREMRSLPEETQKKRREELIGKLSRLGLVNDNATLDDVLSLTQKDILNRRLQTFVFKKGLARSIYQARQLVVHQHISVNGKVVSSPSYVLKKGEDAKIEYREQSPLRGHPEKIFGAEKPEDVLETRQNSRKPRSFKPRGHDGREGRENKVGKEGKAKSKKPAKESEEEEESLVDLDEEE